MAQLSNVRKTNTKQNKKTQKNWSWRVLERMARGGWEGFEQRSEVSEKSANRYLCEEQLKQREQLQPRL